METSGVILVGPSGVQRQQRPRRGSRESNYSMENPANPLDGGSLDEWGGMSMSTAGIKVSEVVALSCPAVWQAITQIAGDVAKLPLHLYKRGEGDSRERASDHSVYHLVRVKPNREMDAFKFWNRFMVQLLLYNNAYIYIAHNATGPAELAPLLSDRTCPHRIDGSLFYLTEVNGQMITVPQENIIHVERLSIDGLAGFRFIQAARDTLGLSLAAHNFASKFFARGGRKGGVLEIPAGTFRKPSADALEEGFRKKYDNADAAFLTVILREGAKFHEAQSSLEESQLTESRKENVRDVSRYYNIRPGRLGEDSGVSYASKSEDNRDYLDTTLSPHLEAIVGQCNIKLLSEEEQKSHYFEHNTERLLRMDPLKHMSQLTLGVRGTIITQNEARKSLNLPPMPGGDELTNPAINPANAQGGIPEAVNNAHRDLVGSLTGVMMRAFGDKALRLSATAKGFLAWLDGSLRDERDRLRKAVLPAMKCIAAITGEDAAAMAAAHADSHVDRLVSELNAIASKVTEEALRDSMLNHLNSWEYKE